MVEDQLKKSVAAMTDHELAKFIQQQKIVLEIALNESRKRNQK